MEKVLKRLGVEPLTYAIECDPTKQLICNLEWTISCNEIKEIEKLYDVKVKGWKKNKITTDDNLDLKKKKNVDKKLNKIEK